MMNRIIKWMSASAVLAILLFGIAAPLMANDSGPGINGKAVFSITENKLDDPPWDPGDEQPARPVHPDDKFASTDRGRGDDPWDPGDESGPTKGVRHG